MSGEASTGIGSLNQWAEAHARESEARATEEHAERFARALAPYVAAQMAPVGSGAADPPEGWRAGASVLTQEANLAPRAEATAGGGPGEQQADSQRVVLNLQTGDLGELSLVLERSDRGVRVVIGVADGRAAEAMIPEREALLRQLEQSGIRIDSVQIVRQAEVGILLAPSRTIGSPRCSGPLQRTRDEEAQKTRRRTSRKIDVIG